MYSSLFLITEVYKPHMLPVDWEAGGKVAFGYPSVASNFKFFYRGIFGSTQIHRVLHE